MTTKIVLGLDGSEPCERAVEWCAAHAAGFGAEVVAVHAVDVPAYGSMMGPYVTMPPPSEAEREELCDMAARDWCKPLADAGVDYQVVVADGPAASAVIAAAEREHADLVVVGRRGRGGFAELLLGSTSHALSHHVRVPLVIVP